MKLKANTIERLLDEMAPVRRLSRNEINLLTRPWITNGLLKSMKNRDKIHKSFLKEKDTTKKEIIFKNYKATRNMIKILIRQCKRDYYITLFEQNRTDMKKTWERIRNIVNLSKKLRVTSTQINYNNEIKTDKVEMADTINEFFVGIGGTGKRHLSEYMGERNTNSIFLKPVEKEGGSCHNI